MKPIVMQITLILLVDCEGAIVDLPKIEFILKAHTQYQCKYENLFHLIKSCQKMRKEFQTPRLFTHLTSEGSLQERDPNLEFKTTRRIDNYKKQPFLRKDSLTVPELLSQLQLLIDSVFDCQTDLIPDLQLQTHRLIMRLEEKFKQKNRKEKNSQDGFEQHSILKQQNYQLQRDLDEVNVLLKIKDEELKKINQDIQRDRFSFQKKVEEIERSRQSEQSFQQKNLETQQQMETLKSELEEIEREFQMREKQFKDKDRQKQQLIDQLQLQLLEITKERNELRKGDLGDILIRLEDHLRDDKQKNQELQRNNQLLNEKILDLNQQLSESKHEYKRLREKYLQEKARREEVESEHEHKIQQLKRKMTEEPVIYRDLTPSKVVQKSDNSKINDLQQEIHKLQLDLQARKEKSKGIKEKLQSAQIEIRDLESQLMESKRQSQQYQRDLQQLKSTPKKSTQMSQMNTSQNFQLLTDELESQIRQHQQKELLLQGQLTLQQKELENLRYENQELRYERQDDDIKRSMDESDHFKRQVRRLEHENEILKQQNHSLMRNTQAHTIESILQEIRDIVTTQTNTNNIDTILEKLHTLESLLSICNSNMVISRSIPTVFTETSPRATETHYSFNPNK